MSIATKPKLPRVFIGEFKWGTIGTAAPVFPGWEFEFLDHVADEKKPDAVWHRERARGVLRSHPEVKQLMGRYPLTAICCLAAAAAQIGLAMLAAHLAWWNGLAIAYVLGAPINIMLFQLAHECDHCLVFKKASWNRYLFTLTSLPMFLSGHHTWWVEHLTHHNDMGATKDFLTRRRTFFLMSRKMSPLFFPYALLMLVTQAFRSAYGLLVYVWTSLLRGRLQPSDFALKALADEHLVGAYHKHRIERWAVVYPLLNFALCAGLFLYGGWKPVVYLLLAQLFFTGFLHPYCIGWVLGISHFHGCKRYQPSASHYGRLVNLLTFNAGLHVEHHDLMGIPWFRLWKLRKLAPEYYDDLDVIRSYTLLGLQFVFANSRTFEENFNHEYQRYADRVTSGEWDPK
jgi:sphingolipid delta-4 desaturase